MTEAGSDHTLLVQLRAGRAVQWGWLCFAAFAVSMALAGIAPYVRLAATACEHEPCLSLQLSSAEMRKLFDAGYVLRSEDARIQAVVVIFPAAFAILLAAFGIWRRPTDPAVVLLSFVLTAFGAGEFAYALAREVPSLHVPAAGLRLAYLAGLAPCLGLLPGGRLRPRWLGWTTLGVALLGVPVALDVAGPPIPMLFAGALAALGVGGLTVRYRALPPGAEQDRVVWALVALALFAGAQLLGRPLRLLPLPRSPLDTSLVGFGLVVPIGMVLLIGGMACLSVALLHDELFDAELVLNRALVYGVLTVCVIGSYVLVVGYLSLVFQARGNIWLSLVATGVVAALFQPLRDRMQRLVNRLLYGARDEPFAVVARLARRLEEALLPEAVLPTIVQAVATELKLPYAAIALRQPDGSLAVRAAADSLSGRRDPAREGTSTGDFVGAPVEELAGRTVVLPLLYRGEPVGQLVVAPRHGEASLSAADRRLLEDLARQAGAAAHAVRLTDALQRSRAQLVQAREEERRRMRRDLHDGLGPALATITLQADTARGLVRAGPAEAEALLGDLTAQAQATMGEVRRLIHALRPPVLDDLGLTDALRALSASFGPAGPAGVVIVVEAPADMPLLPAAVEVAAYRIVQEALTNVVRHAGARRCLVRVRCDGVLHLSICDDGCGIAAGLPAGVGLASMRERAEELGGRCDVLPGAAGGTSVRADLPLAGQLSRGSDDGSGPPADR